MTDLNFHIETTRLRLSYFLPSNDSHCDFLVYLYNTPEFIASIGGNPTSITTRSAARQRLEKRFREEHARNGYGTYLISLKPDLIPANSSGTSSGKSKDNSTSASYHPGEHIGTVSLMRGEGPNSYNAPDIGFAIIPAETGKGYATEAARALLDYAGRELAVKDLFAFFAKGNVTSKAVVKKLGFEDRGARELKAFGGLESEVWTVPGMDADLRVYGME